MSGILGKLMAVALRQMAKPVSLTLKAQAVQHPRFRKTCMFIAQSVHSIDIRLRMSLLGQKNVKVRPLNDRKAIEDGATFLGESFIFGVAGSIIVYEAYKSRKKQNERNELMEDDIRVLQDEIEYIKKKLELQNVKLDDYILPKDLKPKILKLRAEVDPKIEQQQHIEDLERKYLQVKSSTVCDTKQVVK